MSTWPDYAGETHSNDGSAFPKGFLGDLIAKLIEKMAFDPIGLRKLYIDRSACAI